MFIILVANVVIIVCLAKQNKQNFCFWFVLVYLIGFIVVFLHIKRKYFCAAIIIFLL